METTQLWYVANELSRLLFKKSDPQRIRPEATRHELQVFIQSVLASQLLEPYDTLTPRCERLLLEFYYNHKEMQQRAGYDTDPVDDEVPDRDPDPDRHTDDDPNDLVDDDEDDEDDDRVDGG